MSFCVNSILNFKFCLFMYQLQNRKGCRADPLSEEIPANQLYATIILYASYNLFLVNSKSSSTAIHCLLIFIGLRKCWQNFVIQSVFAILICHIGHTINLRALIFSTVVVLVQINNFEK